MSTLKTMYSAQVNSPITTLTGALTASQTSISVADASILPSAPNLLVIGGDTVYAETILMTVKNISTNKLTVIRAVEGNASSWPAGSIIGRFFTALDYNNVLDNINTLNVDKIGLLSSAVEGNFPAFDASGDIEDSGYSPDSFAAINHNHTGVYEPSGTVNNHNSSNTAHSSLFANKAGKSTQRSVTISASSWNTSGTYPTYTLSVTGLTASQVVELIPAMTISKTALDAYQNANIICIAQASGSLTLTAYGDVPTANIPLILILRGDL